jgi:hypothetical protein
MQISDVHPLLKYIFEEEEKINVGRKVSFWSQYFENAEEFIAQV